MSERRKYTANKIDEVVAEHEADFLRRFRQRRQDTIDTWDNAERIGTLEERLEVYDEILSDEEKRLNPRGKWDEEEVTISKLEKRK